jgi:hypothetical protein
MYNYSKPFFLIGLIFLCCCISSLAQTPMAGTYTIGATGSNYTTINAAVNALKSNGVNGAVVCNIKSGTYPEIITIPTINGTSSNNKITFQSASGQNDDVKINGLSPGTYIEHHIIRLDSAQFINLKNLTVENLNTTYASGIHITNGTADLSIENCKITVPELTSSLGKNDETKIVGIILSEIMDTILPNGTPYPIGNSSISIKSSLFRYGAKSKNVRILSNTIIGGDYAICIANDYRMDSVIDSEMIVRNNKLINCVAGIFLSQGNASGVHIDNNYIEIRNHTELRMYGIALVGNGKVNSIKSMLSNNYIQYPNYSTGSGSGIAIGYINDFNIFNNVVSVQANSDLFGLKFGFSCKNIQVYHNTIFGTSLTLASASEPHYNASIVFIGPFNKELTFHNNIFCNFGEAPVFITDDTSAISQSNYNLLYSNATQSLNPEVYLVQLGGSNKFSSLSEIQQNTRFEQNSISINPEFISPNDFHTLNPKINAAGKPGLGINTDFDGEPRNRFEPDIGADEFVLEPFDIGVVDIKANKNSDSSVSIKAFIQNLGLRSVEDSMLSFKYSIDNGSSWSDDEIVQLTGLKKPYNIDSFIFTKPYNPGLQIEQQLSVKLNSSSLRSDTILNNNRMDKKICLGTLSGTYTVGSSSFTDFKNLAAASRFLGTVCTIGGPVVFNIEAGQYNESISVPYLSGTSSINTITFQSATGNATDVKINAVGTGPHVFQLNGSQFVRLKSLTFINQSTDNTSCIQICNNAKFNEVKGCNLLLDTTGGSQFAIGILLSDSEDIKKYSRADSNLFINNNIVGGNFGILFQGDSNANSNGNIFEGNKINKSSEACISLNYIDLFTIKNNTLSPNPFKYNTAGIDVKSATTPSQTLKSFEISGNTINSFSKHGLKINNYLGTDSFLIANNMISGGNPSQKGSSGLCLENSGNAMIYYNSINFKGNKDSSYAAYFRDVVFTSIVNNIFLHSSQGYSYFASDNSFIETSDYNDLYSDGPWLAQWQGQKQANLNALQSSSGLDANSISIKPNFASEYNLHCNTEEINGAGLFLAQVAKDIDGQERDTENPDMGADEFSLGLDASISAILKPLANEPISNNKEQEVVIEIKNLGTIPFSGFKVRYQANNQSAIIETVLATVQFGETYTHTFKESWAPNLIDLNAICMSIEVTGDIDLTNDSKCLEMSPLLSTASLKNQTLELIVYPNPSKEQIYISLNREILEPINIKAINLLGKTMFTKNFNNAIQEPLAIDVSHLSKGFYFLIISLKDQQFVRKINLTN